MSIYNNTVTDDIILLDIKSGQIQMVEVSNHDPRRNQYLGFLNCLICVSRYIPHRIDHFNFFNPLTRGSNEFIDVDPEAFYGMQI